MSQKRIFTKRSCGIALCRTNRDSKSIDILMVKKRYTYSFFIFVMGRYGKNDNHKIRLLLSSMTSREKLLIMGLKFELMWNEIWGVNPEDMKLHQPPHQHPHSPHPHSPHQHQHPQYDLKHVKGVDGYFGAKTKFDNLFVKGGNHRLFRMIKTSKSVDTLWEIPRGRKKTGESYLDTAIREMYEETDLTIHDYTALWHVPPVIESYVDGNKYINTYYIAKAPDTLTPKINFNNAAQIYEIDSIKWMNIRDLKFAVPPDKYKHAVNLHKRVVAKYKKNI